MSKTASGLVDYARAQLGLPYWWGGYGQTANSSLLAQMKKQYPSVYNTELYSNAISQFGKRVHDCVGLIKGYRWSATPTSNPVYNASQDVAVNGLYLQCGNKGTISKIPDSPGTCVFMADMSHVGVYIGNGKVIEARGHAYGVVETNLSGRGWSLWGQPNWIEYGEQNVVNYTDYFSKLSEHDQSVVARYPILKMGNEGSYVGALQMLLSVVGDIDVVCDGDFGTKTYNALVSWQEKMNLEPDGVCGKQTYASFFVT